MPLCPQITNTPITVTYNSTDYILDSVQDVQTTATTFYAAPTPTAQAVGDIWYDTSNGNKQYRWDGSTWVSVQDGAIATAYSLAYTANSNATVATSTANGKNTVTYSTSSASGSGTRAGDVWFKYQSGTGIILNQYTWNGSSWDTTTLSDSVIASITAGKITAGTITVALGITNPSGNFTVDATTGKLTATGVDINGKLTSSSGTIGGFDIQSGYLNYGGTYLMATNGNGQQASYSFYSDRGVYASTFYSTGSALFNGLVTAAASLSITGGNLTLGGGLYGITQAGAGSFGSVSATLLNTGGGTYYLNNSGTLNVGQTTVNGNLAVTAMSSTSATGVVWSSSNNRFYLTTSTERHKDNIISVPEADYLSKLLELDVVTFNYKPEFTDNPNQLISGLIAEKVAAIPEFSTTVNLDKDGLPESIAYDRLAMFMIPALKQINERLLKLEGK